MELEQLNKISEQILKSAFKVHTALGPGLLEKAYEECLCYELKQAGLKAEKQKLLPLVYFNVKLEAGYKIDLFVEDRVIVELKTVERITDVHKAQLLTYLRLSKCRLGLLLNFNVISLKDGIKRVVN